VDQLTMEQLARKTKNQLSLASPPTPKCEPVVTRHLNIFNHSHCSSDSNHH
jgi:hypothetical protein